MPSTLLKSGERVEGKPVPDCMASAREALSWLRLLSDPVGMRGIDPDVAWAKLESLAQGCEIASRKLTGSPESHS